MLMPKRVKFRRMQRGRMTGKATRGNTVSYGEYGLMALEPGWVKSNQIEAARIAMTRYTKRSGLDQDLPRQVRDHACRRLPNGFR